MTLCRTDEHHHVHRRHRGPVLDYRCAACRRVYDALAVTPLAGTRRTSSEIVLIHRGFAKGVPTVQLAPEPGCDREHFLMLRRLMQDNAERWPDRNPLGRCVAMSRWGHNIKDVSGEHPVSEGQLVDGQSLTRPGLGQNTYGPG